MMKLNDILDLYQLISNGVENVGSRKRAIALRKKELGSLEGFNKLAFDTRRIDQEVEYNPRRGLQNYHRSEPFLSESVAIKLANLIKIKKVLETLKEKYGREPEWQDSYCRVLLNTLNNGLRTNQKDGDYTECQPGVGSLDYIEELLDTRYRLNLEGVSKMADEKITGILLSRDEDLVHKDLNRELGINKYNTKNIDRELNKDAKHDEPTIVIRDRTPQYKEPEITRHDVATQSYDSLLDKIFDGVRATKENKNVERSVTITIKDSYLDEKKKKGEEDKEE
jgi:hypothetical protein